MDTMNTEYWDLFDENRIPSGMIHRRGDKIPDGQYHLVIHAWVMDREGRFLISRRQLGRSYEFLWERTGGSVLAGETSLEGAIREVEEELGLKLRTDQAHFVKSVKRERYHDFFDSWLFIVEDDQKTCTINQEEVCDYRWVTLSDLGQLRDGGEVVKSSLYFEEVYAEYRRIMDGGSEPA